MSFKRILTGDDASLFLDRDGVINVRIVDDYVTKPDDFVFLPGVVKAIQQLRKKFGYMFVVTNQQGIGKGLMTHEELEKIHRAMQQQICPDRNVFDRIYYCPNLRSEGHIDRKPNVGMGLKARKDFGVNLKKATMVGDSLSDMEFGKNLGMKTVFIAPDAKTAIQKPALIDYYCQSLEEFANLLPV